MKWGGSSSLAGSTVSLFSIIVSSILWLSCSMVVSRSFMADVVTLASSSLAEEPSASFVVGLPSLEGEEPSLGGLLAVMWPKMAIAWRPGRGKERETPSLVGISDKQSSCY